MPAIVFADVSGMALSLAAIWVAARPRTDGRTYGLYRLEIVAATANAILLLGVSIVVVVEGVRRFLAPPEIAVGHRDRRGRDRAARERSCRCASWREGRHESLNVRGAYLEVAGDLLGAARGARWPGLVIFTTGWTQADAVASIAIGILIVPRAVGLLRDSIDILLEATPEGRGPRGGPPPHPRGDRGRRRP